MKLPRLAKKLLILISLSLSGCSGFPKLHPHLIAKDKSGVYWCGEYEIVKQEDACNIEYKFKEWHPLEKCNGYFSFPPEDISALKKYQAGVCANK